jgi:hypothetical protein
MHHKIDEHGRLWVYPDANLPDTEDEVLEYLGRHGFEIIPAEAVGALTSGTILSDASLDDEGQLPEGARVWWHANYQVEDMAEAVRAGGLMLHKGA